MIIDNKLITILIADDDPDDRLMIKEALEAKWLAKFIHLQTGYLQRLGGGPWNCHKILDRNC